MSAERGKSGFGSQFTQDRAQKLWDDLCIHRFNASLGFTYHERLAPAETYSVTVQLGLGTFPAFRLRELQEIAEEHDCEAHILGNGGLTLLPKRESRAL